MYSSTRVLHRRCAATLLLLTLTGSGCQTWRVEPVRPESLLAIRRPTLVRVTRSDGSRVVLEDPALRPDTLRGIASSQDADLEVDIPLADVRQLETRHFSVGRTVGLGVGLVAAAFATIVAVFIISCSGGRCN